MIDNILDFKDHATALIGIDISEFISYIINKHSLCKKFLYIKDLQFIERTRHSIKFEEIFSILKPWALY